jgi:hypothetical protein
VIALVVLVLSAFAPYTSVPGLRYEQVAVYGLCALGLARMHWLRSRVDAVGGLVVMSWAAFAAIGIVGLLTPPHNLSGIVPGGAAAGLDNLVLPLAVMGTTWTFTVDSRATLRAVCVALVVAAMANAALAAVSLGHDLTPFLSAFWDNNAAQQAVAERAGGLGRYTGIVNQPAEAGELYSIALLAAVHLLHNQVALLALAGTVLTVGGVLTVSKIFLLIGLPVGLWQGLVDRRAAGRRVLAAVVVTVGGWVVVRAGVLPRWSGVDFLTRLFDPTSGAHSAVDLYTAGRFGERGTLSTAVNAVLQSSPWFGFGAQGLAVPYDNAWVEAFVVAGVCGALLYTAVLGLLVVAWWRRRSRFAGGLVLVVIGASMGLPALTANRVATLAWVLLTLLLFTPTSMPGAPDEPSDRCRHPLWTARADIAAPGGVTVLRRRPGRRRQ